jgi:dethiobiotin synthetase
MQGVFVTGTDTGCGKTRVAGLLIRSLRERGVQVAGFKPVAAGAVRRDGILQNDDALALAEASGLDLPYTLINPYCFAAPVSPHLAAADVGATIDLRRIREATNRLAAAADFLVVEGAGGWRVPLGPDLDMQDLARELGYPVVLVVGLKLGCLNHALLTAQVIRDSGLPLTGWIGNRIDPDMSHVDENVMTLKQRLGAPCLGVLPFVADGVELAPQALPDVAPLLIR